MPLNKLCLTIGVILLLTVNITACNNSTPPVNTSVPTETPIPLTATPLPQTDTPLPTLVPPTQPAQTLTPIVTNSTPGGNTAGDTSGDAYQYIGQDLPDNYQVAPGREVTITWTVKNTGINGWSTSYSLHYFTGVKARQDVYPFTKTVPPGKTTNLSVTFIAPAVSGSYDTWWKLVNPHGQNFGDVDFVFIVK